MKKKLDMNELTLPNTCQLDFLDKDDLLNFKLIVCPDEVILIILERLIKIGRYNS